MLDPISFEKNKNFVEDARLLLSDEDIQLMMHL